MSTFQRFQGSQAPAASFGGARENPADAAPTGTSDLAHQRSSGNGAATSSSPFPTGPRGNGSIPLPLLEVAGNSRRSVRAAERAYNEAVLSGCTSDEHIARVLGEGSELPQPGPRKAKKSKSKADKLRSLLLKK